MQVTDVPSTVRFYDHRGKHIALLPVGSDERKQAEAVAALREQQVTFADISAKGGISLSTAHRLLHRLNLTLEVEAGKRDVEIRRIAREARRAAAAIPGPRSHRSSTAYAKAV